MNRNSLIEIICGLLILLFVYTGLSKLYERSFFETQLSLYPYIRKFAAIFSWALPVLELITALLLLVQRSRTVGLYASVSLLSVFTIYLVVMLISESGLPCSCGGVLQQMTWQQHILFNSGLIIITIAGIITQRKTFFRKQDR